MRAMLIVSLSVANLAMPIFGVVMLITFQLDVLNDRTDQPILAAGFTWELNRDFSMV